MVERIYFELGENNTDVTGDEEEVEGSKIVFRHWPVKVSHIRLIYFNEQ